MAEKFLGMAGLSRLWAKVKAYIDGLVSELSEDVSAIPVVKASGGAGCASGIWEAVGDGGVCLVLVDGSVEVTGADGGSLRTGSFVLQRSGASGLITTIDNNLMVGVSAPAEGADAFACNGMEFSITPSATDSRLGLVKLDSSSGITSEGGALKVGGRLGQTAQGGLFYPPTSIPVQGGGNSLLLSEAVGLSIGSRSMAITGGNNVTLKVTAAAGATAYEISNTQNNRFICACWAGGRLAVSQAGAAEKTVAIASVKFANGADVTPYFGAAEADNNIIVTVDETLNPDGTLKAVRGYGKWSSTDTLSVGQGNGSVGGKTLLVGMALYTNPGSQNQIAMIGNRMYTTKGSCIVVGADNINTSQFGAVFGEGHNTTGGPSGIALFGRYSSTQSDTLMAVGNGTNYSARGNAFEVKADGRVKASGTPTDSDDLATKAYVDSAIGGGGLAVQTFGNADFTYEQVLDPDTGDVVNECVAYSTASGNANEPTAIKYGRIVNLAGAFKNVGARASSAPFDMGKVPSGCEPAKPQYILSQGSTQHKFMLTIRPDGTINCSRYSTGASALAVTDGAWLNINATYVSAS